MPMMAPFSVGKYYVLGWFSILKNQIQLHSYKITRNSEIGIED